MALISVIIPTYNEEENIRTLYERFSRITKNSKDDFELIFVDDGSTDQSFNILKEISVNDDSIKIIQFSKNFGSHAACLAGLIHSKGDACTFISADLQDPPEMILELIGKWKEGYEVVFGVREWNDSKTLRFLPRIYYKLVRKFALKNMPEGGTDVFLIDRKVINSVISMEEKNTSIFGLILWSGFNQVIVTYKKVNRFKGISKWSLSKKIKLFVDTFVSFSYFPLRVMSLLGIITAFVGFIYAIVIIAARLIYQTVIEGWSSLMIVLLIVSGIQMIMLGILGEYLWRNFDESRKRPSFIIKNIVGLKKNGKRN